MSVRTSEEVEMNVCRLVREGQSISEVARKMNIPKNTVSNICRRNGVKSKFKFPFTKKKSFWEKFWS